MKTAEEQLSNQLIPRLIALNCLNFDYVECLFSVEDKNEEQGSQAVAAPLYSENNKQGCGRVCFYQDLGIINSYTLECNYQTGKRLNHINPRVDLMTNSNYRMPEVYIKDIKSKIY